MKYLRYIFFFLVVFQSCTLPKIAVDEIDIRRPHDETIIGEIDFHKFDFEQFVRTEYPKYKIHKKDESEIIFYHFIDSYEKYWLSTVYILETIQIKKIGNSEIKCSLRYFQCLNENLNRLRYSHSGYNSISDLRQKIITWKKKLDD
jgi:hypothetical protein